ncbi:MAG: hypothetical protein HYU85_08690 [Chloroflexi bacterium]|nr:hypothetical protein [Chloroflexota bacterium]MBI3930875.1 hypothetical protein [Chloroflexota bacterium]
MKRIGILLIVILVMLGLFGCGKGTDSSIHNINLSIVSQTLYGARADRIIPFKQGEKVTISISADESMELFLHGYDVETRVKPGVTSTLQFAADVLGRFPLMIHSLGEGEEKQRVEILLGLVDVLPRK